MDTVPILFEVEALGMGAVQVDVDVPNTAMSSASVVFLIATDSCVSILATKNAKSGMRYRVITSILALGVFGGKSHYYWQEDG